MTQEIEQAAAKSRQEVSNETLEAAKGKFDEVLIVGIKDGVIDMSPSVPTYIFAHYLLNRATFELNISEKAQLATEKK